MELRGVRVGSRGWAAASEQRVPQGTDESSRLERAWRRSTFGEQAARPGRGGPGAAARVLEAGERGHLLGVHDKRGADRETGIVGRTRSGSRQLRPTFPPNPHPNRPPSFSNQLQTRLRLKRDA